MAGLEQPFARYAWIYATDMLPRQLRYLDLIDYRNTLVECLDFTGAPLLSLTIRAGSVKCKRMLLPKTLQIVHVEMHRLESLETECKPQSLVLRCRTALPDLGNVSFGAPHTLKHLSLAQIDAGAKPMSHPSLQCDVLRLGNVPLTSPISCLRLEVHTSFTSIPLDTTLRGVCDMQFMAWVFEYNKCVFEDDELLLPRVTPCNIQTLFPTLQAVMVRGQNKRLDEHMYTSLGLSVSPTFFVPCRVDPFLYCHWN